MGGQAQVLVETSLRSLYFTDDFFELIIIEMLISL